MAYEPMADDEDTADVLTRGFHSTGAADPTPPEVQLGDADYVEPDLSARPATIPPVEEGDK